MLFLSTHNYGVAKRHSAPVNLPRFLGVNFLFYIENAESDGGNETLLSCLRLQSRDQTGLRRRKRVSVFAIRGVSRGGGGVMEDTSQWCNSGPSLAKISEPTH